MPLRFWRYILIAAALIYVIYPFDVVPDAAGLLGRLDDLVVVVFIFLRYRTLLRQVRQSGETRDREKFTSHTSADAESKSNSANQRRTNQAKASRPDPYLVLGISKGATKDQIRSAYHELAAQYHPDKVAHLGPELQKLAHDKMIEIQQAFDAIK